jgi:hypothetical protein
MSPARRPRPQANRTPSKLEHLALRTGHKNLLSTVFRDDAEAREVYVLLYRSEFLAEMRKSGYAAWALKHLDEPDIAAEARAAEQARKDRVMQRVMESDAVEQPAPKQRRLK